MNAAAVSFPLPQEDRNDTLAGLVDRLEANDALALPDRTVQLSKVRMVAGGTIIVPAVQGSFAMTEWSRGQLARQVGVSWERFFQGAKPNDIAEEMNRRFARATEVMKVRSVSRVPEGIEATGTITALVGPDYSPIADSVVGGVLRDALVAVEPDTRIVRYDTTELTTSYVVTVGQKLTTDAKVGAIQGCLHVCNSQVGYAKLVVQLLILRKVCSNGLVIPLPGAVLARQVHRGIDISRVRERVVAGLRDLPSLVVRASNMMAASTRVEVTNVELEVRDILREARLPLRLVSSVMASYLREPGRSRFTVSQAVTLAAQSETPETRFALERAAGLYLAQG